jgi:hypothetical protein
VTIDSIGDGKIKSDETVIVNGLNFRILADVFFVDDPNDGLGIDGNDDINNDYKRVSLTVVWGDAVNENVDKSDAMYLDNYKSKRISLVSQFVPPGGLETADPTKGTLSINVLDTGVNPILSVEGAKIRISTPDGNVCGADKNEECLNNPIDLFTDSDGNAMLIGIPICDNCYEIKMTSTSSGDTVHESRETLEPFSGVSATGGDTDPPYEEGEFQPRYMYQGVSSGNITMLTFNTNELSTLNIVSKDALGEEIPNVSFDIEGGEIIGTDEDGNNVYKFNKTNFSTSDDSDAEIDVYTDTDSWNGTEYTTIGEYTVTNVTKSGYVFWKLKDNDGNNQNTMILNADTDMENELILLDEDYDSVFIQILEEIEVDGDTKRIPVADASVTLERTDTPLYDTTLTTDESGYVFFPENSTDTLTESETYNITVTKDGYDDNTSETIEIDDGLNTMIDELDGSDNLVPNGILIDKQ